MLFRLQWPAAKQILEPANGQLLLELSAFYPCTLKRGDQLYRLVSQYGDAADVETLHRYLSQMRDAARADLKNLSGLSPISRQIECRITKAEREEKLYSKHMQHLAKYTKLLQE